MTFTLTEDAKRFPLRHPSPSAVTTTRSLMEQESDRRRLGARLHDRACFEFFGFYVEPAGLRA